MKNRILLCIVAILCTVAVCVTYACCNPARKNVNSKDVYISEQEAAEYLGINENLMVLMRDKLKYFEGSYMSYTYLDSNKKPVTIIVYNKTALDKSMADLMNKNNTLNFKYLQEVYEK